MLFGSLAVVLGNFCLEIDNTSPVAETSSTLLGGGLRWRILLKPQTVNMWLHINPWYCQRGKALVMSQGARVELQNPAELGSWADWLHGLGGPGPTPTPPRGQKARKHDSMENPITQYGGFKLCPIQ
jgi:hypothetical protein